MGNLRFATALLVACSLATTAFAAEPFLSLPFNDPEIKIQQGWYYTDSSLQNGIDYIKGEIDRNPIAPRCQQD